MTLDYVLTGAAALAAGIINSLAGGGSFLTFPALMAAGLAPIAANATSTVALFPGQASSIAGARKDLKVAWEKEPIDLKWMSVISLFGGGLGALLLLMTPEKLFASLVPFLLLGATTIFAIGTWMPKNIQKPWLGRPAIYCVHSAISIYGGYFGGGIGILMLAALTLYGWHDIRQMNAVKILFAWVMNVTAVIAFVIANRVHWDHAIVMGLVSVIGGYVGARLSGSIPPLAVRLFVIAVGCCLSIWYFAKL